MMETRKRVLGQDHSDTLTSMNNLASTYQDQGQRQKAEEGQMMETRKMIPGPEHPSTLSSMNKLAFTWKAQGKNINALALLEECLRNRIENMGIDHPRTHSSLETLSQWSEDSSCSNYIGKLQNNLSCSRRLC